MGVKSLWQLLEPVGRPVLLETMEGKSMAIDSSIWIYQFQATMRDKEGRGLVNAHVLGFLRRICKLLFYGIKPVFVFDGGAPALKMSTIAERKKKKTGAAASHAKIAEKLLAAQMRREALDHATGKTADTKGKGKARGGPARIDENTVFLEDLTGSTPKTPAAKKSSSDGAEPTPPSSKKKRWQDHDPYKLPEVNMDEVVAKATASGAPDPRLATEEELRAFIEEMRPEDFDVTSPAFRELPTEVQYEIIGDLRLKSRQTSYKRLQSMLRNAKTPLDFSKEQIKNLKQRNALTQQLLVTTDSIGKAHITIPVRIASERNKQYVLIKNEGDVGGWVLGIRDEGTAAKPIEIDPTPAPVKEDSDEDDMEEVPIAPPAAPEPYDQDLREFRRGQALAALSKRYTPKKLEPLTTKATRKRNARPLFEPEEDELPQLGDSVDDVDDPELTLAIQESIEAEEEAALRRALEESRKTVATSSLGESSNSGAFGTARPPASIDRRRSQQFHAVSDDSDDEDLYASPTRLETALSIGGAAPRRPPQSRVKSSSTFPVSSTFGMPTLLMPELPVSSETPEPEVAAVSESDEDMEEVPVESALPPPLPSAATSSEMAPGTSQTDEPMEEVHVETTLPSPKQFSTGTSEAVSQTSRLSVQGQTQRTYKEDTAPIVVNSESDEDMEEVLPPAPSRPSPIRITTEQSVAGNTADASIGPLADDVDPVSSVQETPALSHEAAASSTRPSSPPPRAASSLEETSPQAPITQPAENTTSKEADASESESDNEDEATADPTVNAARRAEDAAQGHEDWDAAQELDPHAEEGEFARFLSQMKGKDIDAVRREIDEEIRELNKQKKNAMRDSEDITQQMISQIMIMLRLFGIPYITAPMEAEAQCAALLTLGLVDGIITDDSDVFLFGGARVLKNMFNQSKTVECFLLSDLERELGLDRDKLIRLAYLLGSDYTEGLPGVGPVVAMELLNEFPGQDGLHKFKAWWQKVQSGRDRPEESASKFRRRFKKKFKELYLPGDWPNPAVRDAYYHPTVDESREPFKWGMPDLDALRSFFNAELGWDQGKVDELLLPIIRKMNKRSQNAAPTMQGNLVGFFDVPLGGNAAPRKRQAYTSKRLQQVVQDFRKQQAQQRGSASPAPAPRSESASANGAEGSGSEYEDGDAEKSAGRPAKKRRTAATKTKEKGKAKASDAGDAAAEEGGQSAVAGARGAGRARGRGRGRGGAKRTSRKRAKTVSESEEEADDVLVDGQPPAESVPTIRREELGLRPKPKPRPIYRPEAQDVDGEEADVDVH
ncbi:PIN domain-like protein [Trametes coccinea BRFM310]|uniref:PIN domain-like protein n=1 Tax=Trametes coccinea (strain BRFM310) TaxID=1353009 RepID=A0A1Y2IZP0_TRAC3|nr:PIN domain-like protein [Trametes coccinea BRFM310]